LDEQREERGRDIEMESKSIVIAKRYSLSPRLAAFRKTISMKVRRPARSRVSAFVDFVDRRSKRNTPHARIHASRR